MSTDVHAALGATGDLADLTPGARVNAALVLCGRTRDAAQARDVLAALGLLEVRRGPHVGALGRNGQPTTTAGRAVAIELRRSAKQAQEHDIRRLLDDGLTQTEVVDRLGVPVGIVRAVNRRSAS